MQLTLTRDGAATLLAPRLRARLRAERASRTVAVAMTAHLPAVPAEADDYISDLRRGRRWVWGGVLRVVDRMHALDTPMETALCIPAIIEAYIRDTYEVTGPTTRERAA